MFKVKAQLRGGSCQAAAAAASEAAIGAKELFLSSSGPMWSDLVQSGPIWSDLVRCVNGILADRQSFDCISFHPHILTNICDTVSFEAQAFHILSPMKKDSSKQK